jgi:type III restriction enzyme
MIENPVINSPFTEPAKHFRVVDRQVTGEIELRRRPSEFFVPVARPRKTTPQLALQFGGDVRQQQNEIVTLNKLANPYDDTEPASSLRALLLAEQT